MSDEIVKYKTCISNLRHRVQYTRPRDCLDTSRSEILAYYGTFIFDRCKKKGRRINVKKNNYRRQTVLV